MFLRDIQVLVMSVCVVVCVCVPQIYCTGQAIFGLV